jgi:hypothetical protein
MWVIRIVKFLFLVVFLSVLMVFSVVYPIKGFTIYQRAYHFVAGAYPDIDLVTEKQQKELDDLVLRASHKGSSLVEKIK